jgi:hypothetical protein
MQLVPTRAGKTKTNILINRQSVGFWDRENRSGLVLVNMLNKPHPRLFPAFSAVPGAETRETEGSAFPGGGERATVKLLLLVSPSSPPLLSGNPSSSPMMLLSLS